MVKRLFIRKKGWDILCPDTIAGGKELLRFIQKYWKGAIPFLLIILAYNLYFIFLMKEKDIRFLLYLDGLIVVFLAGTQECNI